LATKAIRPERIPAAAAEASADALEGADRGVAAPAGVDGRDPSGAAELRAAWRLWRGGR
jgi:hypothetical protein